MTEQHDAGEEEVEVTPPDDLRPWGWADGHYWINCCDCPDNTKFNGVGAKRSYRCKDHAIAAWRASLATRPTPSSDRVDQALELVDKVVAALKADTDCRGRGRFNAATMIAEALAAKDAELAEALARVRVLDEALDDCVYALASADVFIRDKHGTTNKCRKDALDKGHAALGKAKP